MKKHFKIIAISLALAVSASYIVYPAYVGQKRFKDTQSKIQVGMERSEVLILTKEIGYFDLTAGQKQLDFDGNKVSVNEDIYSYNNLLIPSVLVVEYDSSDIVANIVADQ